MPDIQHHPENLSQLVAKAEAESLDLVSLMVRLRCESFWEQMLIPAFVFFFQKLYPFRWVNDRRNPMAAAAGGCILIRPSALDRIGGLQVLRQALIDDCTLAQAVKGADDQSALHPIWLGLTQQTHSLRPYPDLETIWDMVARTAFTQLHYSPLLLLGTLLGMGLIYLTPPIALLAGLWLQDWRIAIAGLLGWGLNDPSLLADRALLPLCAWVCCLLACDRAALHADDDRFCAASLAGARGRLERPGLLLLTRFKLEI